MIQNHEMHVVFSNSTQEVSVQLRLPNEVSTVYQRYALYTYHRSA